MPRSLSDAEFAQFMTDKRDLVAGLLQEQSEVVNWNGEYVLVYIGPNPIITGNGIYQDVYLSDVSDSPKLTGFVNNQLPLTQLSALPNAVKETIVEYASEAGALISQAGKALYKGAKDLGQPLQDTINIATVALVFGLLFLYAPRKAR